MKTLNLKIICTAALLLAMPIAGCKGGEMGKNLTPNDEITIEETTRTDRAADCDDGDCDKDKDGDCKDGKCPDNKCPDGDCKEGNHKGRHRRGIKPTPLPEPIHED